MKWSFVMWMAILLGMTGCGRSVSSDSSDSESGTSRLDSNGTDSPVNTEDSGDDSAIAASCTEDETRCSGAMIQQCIAGVWKDYDDCTITGQVCGLSKGVAICYSSGGTDGSQDSAASTDSNAENGTDSNDFLGTDEVVGSDEDTATSVETETDTDVPQGTDSEQGHRDTGTVPDTGCGDGVTGYFEACDDGNTNSNDGCSADCLEVENGWLCDLKGFCQPVARCGDGAITGSEMCDDGDTDKGDGCSKACTVETGWECSGTPSKCVHTRCGDGEMAGSEACDDGNTLPFDGCDQFCQREPDCKDGTCDGVCGDGFVGGSEECDDGNRMDADGCSSRCAVEDGFHCAEDMNNGDFLAIPVVYRDFEDGDDDFDQFTMTEREELDGGCVGISEGMVLDTLSVKGKPVLNQKYGDPAVEKNPDKCNDVESADSFARWFAHDPDDEAVVPDILALWKNSDGNYVNTWLSDGTRWARRLDFEPEEPDYQAIWCGEGGDNKNCDQHACAEGEEFDPDEMLCFYPCQPWGDKDMSCAVRFEELDDLEYFDGSPVFFPIDGRGIDRDSYEAKIPEPVYEGMHIYEEGFLEANAISEPDDYSYNHNFFFTSELRFRFRYDAKADQRVTFAGDDDVWIFVNNTLAIDLGGIHVPVEDEIQLQDLESSHKLVDGNVYEIALFHAERRRPESSFRLTLGGFDAQQSECVPECGDGVLSLGEECDDGENSGGYNRCGAGCRLDTYCGDGVIQDAYEDCDDGNFINGDACPTSCRLIRID